MQRLPRHCRITERASAAFLLLVLLQLSACVASLAADPTNAGSTGRRDVVQRQIDWDQANADAANHQSDSQPYLVNGDSARGSGLAGTASAVPVLLPSITVDTNAMSSGLINFSQPALVMSDRGYTAVLKSHDVDIVIDATDSMMTSDDMPVNGLAQNFDGEYQAIEGGGGEISIGRYGALYSIQVMCNQPSRKPCVSEMMVRDIIASLSVAIPAVEPAR